MIQIINENARITGPAFEMYCFVLEYVLRRTDPGLGNLYVGNSKIKDELFFYY